MDAIAHPETAPRNNLAIDMTDGSPLMSAAIITQRTQRRKAPSVLGFKQI
jgi:hypothetical protein